MADAAITLGLLASFAWALRRAQLRRNFAIVVSSVAVLSIAAATAIVAAVY